MMATPCYHPSKPLFEFNTSVNICHSGINQQLKEKDNNKVWPPSLISILQQTMATPCYHPSKPLFEFDTSVEAAEKNYMILMHKFGGDLHKDLHAQQGLQLQYGSEFKPVLILAQIFETIRPGTR